MTWFNPSARTACSVAAAATAALLAGCETRQCLEWREQTYQHQVCERYSETGWCAHMRSETRTRNVCVKYAAAGKPVSRAPSKYPVDDPTATERLFEEAHWRNTNVESRFKQKLRRANYLYPPRSWEECRQLEGTWFGKCERIEKGACMLASLTEGFCTDHLLPKIQDEQACQSVNGRFVPECRLWVPAVKSQTLECKELATYGTCREHVAAAYEARDHVKLKRGAGGIENPRALRPGKSLAALKNEVALIRLLYPPTSFDRCRLLKGAWFGVCTRKAGGKCLEASKTQGVCTEYVQRSVRLRNDCADVKDFRPECARHGIGPDGQETCVELAEYGRCIAHEPRSRLLELHRLRSDGTPLPDAGYR